MVLMVEGVVVVVIVKEPEGERATTHTTLAGWLGWVGRLWGRSSTREFHK